MWIFLALTNAALFGIVSVVDKRLLDRHLPSVPVLYLWISLVLVFYSAIALALTGIPWDAPPDLLLVALISGLSTGIGLALMFLGLKQEEASRAIAITQIYPVFVAVLAVLFLGETLGRLQWAAIGLVVAGTMLISLRGAPNRRLLRPTRGTPVLLSSGLLLGLGFFTAKIALGGLSVGTVFVVQQMGIVLIFGLFARPRVWRQMCSALKDRNTLLLMLIGEGVLPIIAIVLSLLATSLGPVSLVTAFLATRPLFLFIVATILSSSRLQLMEESVTHGALALKFTSIVMIIIGVGALGFGS